jgi:NADPH:quinone reductase-like Zn-dependent oxidoreductase
MRRGLYPGQPKFPFVPGYDLVGMVISTGSGVDHALIGQRVAALTKTGGWATHALLRAVDLIPVPAGIDAADAETLVVNGATAWQMLHRSARVDSGGTILVYGANGGVGTVLIQLARYHGITVIAVAASRHHDAMRALGAIPVDYADLDQLTARVREIAPNGVNAVFDNIGGETTMRSWKLLAPGGKLISLAIVSELPGNGNVVLKFLRHLARLGWWSITATDGRAASFYDVWSGHVLRPNQFRARLREDLAAVFALLFNGDIKAQVAARFPLIEVAAALTLAESHTVRGKVVLLP